MDIFELTLPEFIFGEFPIKDGSPNDQRQFIVHRGISLIEVLAYDEFVNITFDDKVSKQYSFFEEDFILVYHTNNSKFYDINEVDLLDQAWKWYREYLIWEDTEGSTDNI